MLHKGLNHSADTSEHKIFPLVLLLFFGSGCAALIYEVVWFQLLGFVIGSSSVSLSVLLGTYMGGMCAGSIVIPRIIPARWNPLRIYAILEFLLGIAGVVILFALPFIDTYYIRHSGSGPAGIFMRAVVCAICLLFPTMLMGATLPVIARWVESTARGASRLGFFYAANITGAVFGTLLTGFYLLRIHDMAAATYSAAAINLIVAVGGFYLSLTTNYSGPLRVYETDTAKPAVKNRAIYIAIAFSGISALGAEVVWTRLLSLVLGGTVYTFSIILSMFLAGLGLGSGIGALLSRYAGNPRPVLGVLQLMLAGAIAWTSYQIICSVPYWPLDPWAAHNPWFIFRYDLLRCFWALMPPACLWGASFTMALACVLQPGRESAKTVGGIYAVNTAGAIIGSLGFSLIIIPLFGTQQAQRILIGIATISSLIVLVPELWPARTSATKVKSPALQYACFVVLVIVLVPIVIAARGIARIPWAMIAYGKMMPAMNARVADDIVSPEDITIDDVNDSLSHNVYCIYAAEGMDESVAVTLHKSGVRSFHSDGKVQASTELRDMRLQRMLGHIPALMNEKPKSVLVVGCGTGVTAGTFVLYPDLRRIVIVDIEKIVPEDVAPLFTDENYNVVKDPRTETVVDDGRHYIHSTTEKFDIITSDMIDPWYKGCAALSTAEYYQMCKDHLSDNGIMSLWIPFYGSNAETVKSLIATFFKVFPDGLIFANITDGKCYDAVLLGQKNPGPINLEQLQQKLGDADYSRAAKSLADVDFNSIAELFATYSGRAADLKPWTADAQINYDKNLRLQYLAGMWLNEYYGAEILSQLLLYYKFPDNLFTGSEETINELKLQMENLRE